MLQLKSKPTHKGWGHDQLLRLGNLIPNTYSQPLNEHYKGMRTLCAAIHRLVTAHPSFRIEKVRIWTLQLRVGPPNSERGRLNSRGLHEHSIQVRQRVHHLRIPWLGICHIQREIIHRNC
jgi:hypothetical protein